MVEDDPDIRGAVAELLQEEGFEVVAASNGHEGLARLAQMTRPCLILLDMNMPVMDGPEFMARIRDDPELRACTVLIVTATKTALPLGADGYLRKPFDIGDLLSIVERYCPHD
jgi:CheY-like chemotaxis protein